MTRPPKKASGYRSIPACVATAVLAFGMAGTANAATQSGNKEIAR